MNKELKFSAVAVFAALSAACGGEHVTSTQAPPAASSTSTPAPIKAIFVASLSGNDANDGSQDHPMRSINAAIRAAQSAGDPDVYLFGGDEGVFTEVVALADGISVHGDLCYGSHSLTPKPDTCQTVISGGSPTMVADGIRTQPTIVENMKIAGLPAVQSGETQTDQFFQVDGIGCVGRGNAPESFARCTPEPDAKGRPTPQSAMGVAVYYSTTLTFRNVDISSAAAANGIDGVDGANGEDGNVGGNGTMAGNLPQQSGLGGAGGVNPACPAANGGAGGVGGRWYWDGVTKRAIVIGNSITYVPSLDDHYVYAGVPGMPAATSNGSAGAGGYGALPFVERQAGEFGMAGVSGLLPNPGHAGVGGGAVLDVSTLLAAPGDDGLDGEVGGGGGGGGGGAPASVEIFTKTTTSSSSGFDIWGYGAQIGAKTSSGATVQTTQNKGETAGGGGAGGGAGGCGGHGGKGGQGGASSVALYVEDSQVVVLDSTIESGAGGNGGRGGAAGLGGHGKNGGQGAAGFGTPAKNVQGNFDNSTGAWVLGLGGGTTTNDSSQEYISGSQGGAGGNGGAGKDGGVGGVGGGGAGGASIGILMVGSSTAVAQTNTTITAGTPGVGGDAGLDASGATHPDAAGATGLQKDVFQI